MKVPRFPFPRPRLLLICLVGLIFQSFPGAAPAKRPIAETDLFAFTWIADPQIAPDGSTVVFVRVTANKKEDGYDTSLWIVPTSGSAAPRQYTSGPRDSSPRWSPDGAWIAFLRGEDRDGKPQPTQVQLMSTVSGEARPLTALPRGVGAPVWSPDGKTIAFTASATPNDAARAAQNDEPRGNASTPGDADSAHVSDVRVITRAVYRANGGGYNDPTHHSHIWTIAVPGNSEEPKAAMPVTSGDFDEQGPVWATDSSRIYYTSDRTAEPSYQLPNSDLYAVPAIGGEPKTIVDMNGAIGTISISGDGARVVFTGIANDKQAKSYNQPDLFAAPLTEGATAKNLTATYDFDISGGLTGDQRAPRGGQPDRAVWNPDGRSVVLVVAEQGRSNLVKVDTTSGQVTPLTTGDHEVISFTATRDGSRLVALVGTPTSIGDLFMVDARGAMTQLTNVNETLFSELDLTPPEEIWTTSFDGTKIQSWVQKPPGFDPAKKYPLILNIHGGPHAAYGYTFDHEFQWMAAKGYVVLAPNPRGSTTYGQQFGNVIQYHYPGDDYKDLMAAVDDLVKRGYVDPERLGVTGGSGGGLLTNWVVTQTDRFAAAVSQRSIADWAGFWYTADFTLFTPDWFKGAPWEDPKDFAARSPITYIKNVKTPLMLIEGEADMRTPPSDGGEQMFRALKYMKVPTAMVQFPGETHELSRSGRPWHRVERLQHIVNWFDKYLQGKPVGTYELQ